MKLLANNKKAYHDYFIEKEIESGIVLVGTEVKSIKSGKVSIKEAYINIRENEIFIENMHVSPYENGNIFNVDPYRTRKLLLAKKEIIRLYESVKKLGYTIVPLKVYVNDRGLVKVSISLAKGKKVYDKREALKQKDASRQMDRALKNY